MSDASRTTLRYVRNSVALGGTLGLAPTSPAFKQLLVLSDGLDDQVGFSESKILIGRPRVRARRWTSIEAGGPFETEPIFGNEDDFLEMLFFNRWQRTPQRFNAAADTQIADIVASTGVITVQSSVAGDENRWGSFQVGHLARLSGCTNTGNNGLRRCTTASDTVPAFTNSGMVNEAAPPQFARLKVVGVEAPSNGNISASTSGLVAGASGKFVFGGGLNPATLGFVAGMWFKAPAAGAQGAFPTAANAGWYRALSVSSTEVHCDVVPAGFADDAASGTQIRLYMPDYLRDGTDALVWADFERRLPQLDVPEFDRYFGWVPTMHEWALAPNGIQASRWQGIASDYGSATEALGGASDLAQDALSVWPRTGDPFDTTDNVASFFEGGSELLDNVVTECTFGLTNGVIGYRGLGRKGFRRISGPKMFRPYVTLRQYYLSRATRQKMRAETITGMATRLLDPSGTKAYIVDYPRGRITQAKVEGIQLEGDLTSPIRFDAEEHTGFNCVAQVMRFEEYA